MSKEVAESVMKTSAFVIAINNSWQLAPDADVLFACDARWWIANPEAESFAGERIVCEDKRRPPYTIFVEPKAIGSGSNSALQAAHWIAGRTERIALFGIDLREDQLTHWHGQHKSLPNPTGTTFQRAKKAWALAQLGTEVVNCSKESALTCFPKMSLEEALA